MTARATAVRELVSIMLDAADRLDLDERAQRNQMLVADLRIRSPESVSPLTLGPLTYPTTLSDPRGRAS